jgi:hypothetical protein
MSHTKGSWTIATCLGLMLLGATSVPAAVTHNKLASNKLASNKLASNKLASNKLASNALSSTRLEASLATAEIVSTADGREVFSYIVSCALPDSLTIEVAVPDAPDSAPPETAYTCAAGVCAFPGGLGLATHWAERKLDPKGQRWVSACLLARVNHFETAEAISLRGLAPELTVGQDEAEIYNIAEGAFFGNLFTDGDGPLDWNACRGEGQARGEGGGLELRDCAEEDPAHPGFTFCGFNYAGDCVDFTPQLPSGHACKGFDAEQGLYDDCHAGEGDGHWPGLRTYREIITVYVAP